MPVPGAAEAETAIGQKPHAPTGISTDLRICFLATLVAPPIRRIAPSSSPTSRELKIPGWEAGEL